MMQDAKITSVASGKQLFIDITPGPSPDAPSIFFMHGLGSSTTFYETALSLSTLALTYRLVRYDFEGHGLSPLSDKADLTIDSLAEDLRDVMDAVGVEKAAGVVGHSMSGLVAMTFAARWPERVEKLFLIGPMKAMAPAGQQVMLTRATTVETSGLSSIVSAVASAATSSQTKFNSPLSLALIRALVLSTPIKGYAAACRALAAGSNPDFGKVEAETLIVGGSEDYLSNPGLIGTLVEGEGAMKKASKVELMGCGHWHAVEQPKAITELLEKFFL